MKKIILLGLVILVSTQIYCQGKAVYSGFPSLVWPKLYNVTYEKVKDEFGEYDRPIFSTEAKSINGKPVVLPGYMVPFDIGTKGVQFVLTSLPLNACFFCGVGGPESVVEVNLKTPITYTDKPIEVKGTLRLNDKDPDRMIYILEQSEYLGVIEY
ncbi:MAG: hypothetical protein OEU76_03935 [Cyclobacteriaceae bacterium]|nr:hypothetical protein [Cyclobacteriaceae bacterium]